MKRRRNLGIFLLTLSFLIPWNVGYLYYDYYTDADILVRKHFSAEEEDGILNLLKENFRALIQSGHPLAQHAVSFLQVVFLQPDSIFSAPPRQPVLRC